MKLKKLFIDLDNVPDLKITGINTDSNLISAGEMFVAIKGVEHDGHKFIGDAIKRGAVAIIKQKNISTSSKDVIKNVVTIDVPDTRKTISELAARFYNFPSQKLKVIGVTGTNGKTTVTYLIESILNEAGFSTGLVGTIHYKFKNMIFPSVNTTPGPLEIQSFLAKMQKEKLKYCIMEVSSHSLDQERVRDVKFHTAVFTNLTQDHLDYHHNLDEYFKAKAKLFTNLRSKSWAIINKDDKYGKKLLKFTKARKITFGFSNGAKIQAKGIKLNINGTEFKIITPKGTLKIKTALFGRHNIYNILAAVAFGFAENIALGKIKRGIEKINYIPGRLESIAGGQKFNLFVDYAHTDDALKNVLLSLREFNKGKIIVVFGCGGQRDISKRAKMGKVVSNLADYFIITNDNPRNENPNKIVRDIEKGINAKKYDVVLDREKAIKKAINLAEEQDTVLIAGKGHETSQIFKNKTIASDDREIAKKALKCLK